MVDRSPARSARPVSAPDARADALHCGAKVIGGDGEGRELVRGYPLREIAEVDGATHADQSGLAAEGFEVSARVAAGEAGYLLQVQLRVCGHVAGVYPQDVQARLGVREPYLDLVVEATRAPEGRVEGRGSVRRGDDADASEVIHAVHEGEELGDQGRLEALAHRIAG